MKKSRSVAWTGLLVVSIFVLKPPECCFSQDVSIPDPVLNDYVRSTLNIPQGQPITPADMQGLTGVEVGGVSNLEGLQYATNLTALSVTCSTWSDLSQLGNFTKLQTLDLQWTGIIDLSSMPSLPNLWQVSIEGDHVQDVSALHGLPQLTSLNMNFTGFTDLRQLSSFTKVSELSLAGNGLSDISALGDALNSLSWLFLGSNSISDLSPLRGINSLEGLDLSFNNISNIEPISGDRISDYLSLVNNPLNSDAYNSYISLVEENNPDLYVAYDVPEPSTVFLFGIGFLVCFPFADRDPN